MEESLEWVGERVNAMENAPRLNEMKGSSRDGYGESHSWEPSRMKMECYERSKLSMQRLC